MKISSEELKTNLYVVEMIPEGNILKIGEDITDWEDWNSVFTLECYLNKKENLMINTQIVNCECGKQIVKSKLDKHLKTKAHINKVKNG